MGEQKRISPREQRVAWRRQTDSALIPIRKTDFYPNLRTGRRECWGAETLDGEWSFQREESSGTPWLVRHRPSVADGSYDLPVLLCGTLRACRLAIGRGEAAEALRTRKRERAEVAEGPVAR